MFRLASISKPLTALAAMSLLEEGKLDLDAPIQRYVPSFPQKRWPVTLRMLLSHQSGIRHYEGDEMSSTRHYGGVVDGLRIFAGDPLAHEPGTKYLYSSYGFNLAGAAVEAAAGMPYWQAVSRRVLQPSGAAALRPDHVYQLIPHRARGYLLGRDGSLQNCGLADTSYKLPGGGWMGSAESLVQVGEAVVDGRLLKPETMRLMWTPVPLKGGKSTGYALGWGVNRLGSEVFYEHSGGQQGTSTHWIVAPGLRAQVVVLANLESAPATEIARELLAELMEGK
jgi:CubicO group peptidase (beta-lactamase class C family)